MSNGGWVAPGRQEDPPLAPQAEQGRDLPHGADQAPWQAPAEADATPPFPPSPVPASPAPGPAVPLRASTAPVGYALAARPGIVPLQPLTLGEILGGAFSLLRFSPRPTLLVALAANLLAGLGAAPATLWGVRQLGAYVDDPATALTGDGGASFVGNVSQGVAGLISSLAVLVLSVVTSRAVLGERIGAGAAWREFRPSLWRSLGLVGLGIVVALGVVVIAVGAMVVNPLLGFVVLVIAGVAAVVLGVRLWLAQVALVLERLGPLDALRRSWALTRGQFWRTLGIVLVAGLVTTAIEMAVAFPLTILGAGLGFVLSDPSTGFGSTLVVAAAAAFLGSLISGLVTTPVQSAVTTLQYVDQRMRKEGFDVVLARAVAARSDDGR